VSGTGANIPIAIEFVHADQPGRHPRHTRRSQRMTDTLINAGILLFTVLIAIDAGFRISDRFRRKSGDDTMRAQISPRGRWALPLYNLIGAALLVVVILRTWIWPASSVNLPSGFNKGWPDAIHCEYKDPDYGAGPSSYNFMYLSVSRGIQKVGDVVRYFLVGTFNPDNSDVKGYLSHELWFTLDKAHPVVPG
jgi:hypothetical protein